MDVDVNFTTDEGTNEVQFSIPPYGVRELDELFTEFCKENDFPKNTVTSVTKNRAESLHPLGCGDECDILTQEYSILK